MEVGGRAGGYSGRRMWLIMKGWGRRRAKVSSGFLVYACLEGCVC